MAAPTSGTPVAATPVAVTPIADKLGDLQKAFDNKLITDAELKEARMRVLGGDTSRLGEDTRSLRGYFEAEEKRRYQKWRVVEEECRAQRESLLAEDGATRRLAFLDQCRSSMVSPEDVMAATYTLFARCDEAKEFYNGLLTRVPPGPLRIRAHNFYVASCREKSFLDTYGCLIEKLAWPLFPPAAEFTTLNQRLLCEASSPPTGGSTAVWIPTVFRHQREEPRGGEYWASVQRTPQGDAVDLSEVERAFTTLQSQLRDWQQRFPSSRGGRGRGGAHWRGRGGRALGPQKCYRCGSEGHLARDCTTIRGGEAPKESEGKQGQAPNF